MDTKRDRPGILTGKMSEVAILSSTVGQSIVQQYAHSDFLSLQISLKPDPSHLYFATSAIAKFNSHNSRRLQSSRSPSERKATFGPFH